MNESATFDVPQFDKWRTQKAKPNPSIDDFIDTISGPPGTIAEWAEYLAEQHPDQSAEWAAEQAELGTGALAANQLYNDVLASLPYPPHPGSDIYPAWKGMLHEALRSEWKRRQSRAELNGRVRFTPLDAFLREEEPNAEWLVPDIIPLDTLIQFLGKLESFKSMGLLGLHVATSYGSQWLGRDIPAMPSFYVSGEKRRRSIRDRLARLTGGERGPSLADLIVVHRSGLIVDPSNEVWLRLVDEVARRKTRCLVSLDTITTLAPPDFKEISGESWALVLAAMRMLTDLPEPATVLGSFHPSKEDKGGINTQSRGHTSFGGEADGALVFQRPSRMVDSGVIHCRPKDGGYSAIPFDWDHETYRLVPKNLTGLPLSHDSLITVVATHGPCDFAAIQHAYGRGADGKWRIGEDRLRNELKAAIEAGDIDTERESASKPIQYFIPQEAA